MSLQAELIEDGGAAASGVEFFRCPEYLAAEAATHTVRITGGSEPVELPVIVRAIEGSGRVDAISPYGYPGAAQALADPPDPAEVDWSRTGLVSLFVRDRIGGASLAGGVERSRVQIADPAAGLRVRKRLQEQIGRNARRGWEGEIYPSERIGEQQVGAFERAYGETMERVGAGERYRFAREYFERIFAAGSSWLVTTTRTTTLGQEVGAAAIAVESDGHLHYFLGGTADDALADSPMKNVFMGMIALARERELPLNLGGGVEPGDSLERFKRGFANATAPFRTLEVVCDAAAYAELSGAGGERGFFPAYRAQSPGRD